MILESPNKTSITIIDDKMYATDEDEKGLYSLIPQQMARYKGEGTLIDENFKLRKGLRKETIKRKIAEHGLSYLELNYYRKKKNIDGQCSPSDNLRNQRRIR